MEHIVAVFRCIADVVFIVVGSLEENELILSSVLDTYIEALNLILRCAIAALHLTCMGVAFVDLLFFFINLFFTS